MLPFSILCFFNCYLFIYFIWKGPYTVQYINVTIWCILPDDSLKLIRICSPSAGLDKQRKKTTHNGIIYTMIQRRKHKTWCNIKLNKKKHSTHKTHTTKPHTIAHHKCLAQSLSLFLPTASSLQYHHLSHEVSRGCWVQLNFPLTQLWFLVAIRALSPSTGEPNLL